MLSREGCQTRRCRLWEALPAPCDLLVVADPQHLIYLLSFEAWAFEFRSNDASALALLTPEWVTLVADSMLEPYLARAFADEMIAPTWYDGRRPAPPRRPEVVAAALEALHARAPRRVGLELAAVPAGLIEGLRRLARPVEVLDLGPVLHELRRRKDPDEVALLRRSMAAAEAGLRACRERLTPGMTELDAFRLVQDAAVAAAGTPVRVYGDFISGPRCEHVGGPPTDRVIRAGELMIVDCSVVLHGYRGDFATTFLVGDDAPSDHLRALHAGCLEALAAGEAALRPGMIAGEIDATVRRPLVRLGRPMDAPGHMGHGLGLSHPEPPFFVPESEEVLLEGDVVAIEPGVYFPGVAGMRYERNFLITRDGCECLTHHSLALTQRG